MYTATMRYTVKEEFFEEVCGIWKESILSKAEAAPGLVRMQFLTARPQALAIGTWKDKKDAAAFMQTGVFKKLMERIEPLLVSRPESEQWELLHFCTGK